MTEKAKNGLLGWLGVRKPQQQISIVAIPPVRTGIATFDKSYCRRYQSNINADYTRDHGTLSP